MPSIGQRVHFSDDERQGVVVASQFDGSRERQECCVQWDDGRKTWEMGTDLQRLPNKGEDAFTSSLNGFGKLDSQAMAPARPNIPQPTAEAVEFLVTAGLLKLRRVRQESRSRQLTLDIRSRCKHGAPVKGGTGGANVEKRVKLAKAAATGEPMLTAEGPLVHRCFIKSKPTNLGWAARAMRLAGKSRTRAQKRAVKKGKG
jgi:hypothetical protein